MTKAKKMTYEEFIATHPEWQEYDRHCKECDSPQCHHDLWGPAPHLYGDEGCRCLECMNPKRDRSES